MAAIDRKAFEKMDYALCVLCAAAGGAYHGCIINSLHQATSSYPAKFTVTVNRDHETCKAIQAAGSFAVTLLSADCPAEIINTFGYRSGRVTDKFAGVNFKTDDAGNPYLMDHAAARISCKVVDQLIIGSYILFVGEATEAETRNQDSVLTLKAYTARGKATPPTATVYRTMEGGGFRCTICGYVHESETLPPDFICPICRAAADKFVKQG